MFHSFGRRRVVIRKGHLGISFYTIFSGSVGVVIDSVDEDKAFDKEKKPANIMCKGDSFGVCSFFFSSQIYTRWGSLRVLLIVHATRGTQNKQFHWFMAS